MTARWRMGDGATLTLAINLADQPAAFPEMADPLFALGEAGSPGSFGAWIDR
ncbi:DUF3459 domain-containing protein [Sphingobium sp. Ant17]|uniref:DUF3459 domain-containing protein n=1 Tax=Sphingobium sp. Ant17 TaxID=1461752 RepID=UPI0004B5BA13|nr:DUF3459 domain-containing protein [Sphingobium sp. Ant17]